MHYNGWMDAHNDIANLTHLTLKRKFLKKKIMEIP